jgi:hypothetical protein
MIIANAEVEKIRAATAKSIGELNFKEQKQKEDEDFRRDEMETKAAVELAKAGLSGGVAVDIAKIRAANELERMETQLDFKFDENQQNLGQKQTELGAGLMERAIDRENQGIEGERKAIVDIGNAELDRNVGERQQIAERDFKAEQADKDRKQATAQAALDRSVAAIAAKRKANGPR